MRSLRLAVYSVSVLTFVFTLGARQVHAGDNISESLTFAMPPCPIPATVVPFTKTEFTLPETNPLNDAATVAGTVQVTDQTSSTVILLQVLADADLAGVDFARTVETLQHATGQLTFDKGCTKTDPYGSNNCHWDWGQSITTAFQGALQEDIPAGKLIVDLKIDSTIPFQFSCPVCGGKCTIPIPEQIDQIDQGDWGEVWHLVISLIRFPLSLTNPPFPGSPQNSDAQ